MSFIEPELIFKSTVINETEDAKEFFILHFNDVYNIESNSQEPVGGAARFITVLENLISQKPTLVFFSGDALSPS
jgi:5'-nucleotidase